MVKDLLTGQWKGPLDLLALGRGYARVSTGHNMKRVPLWCVQPLVLSWLAKALPILTPEDGQSN